MEIKLLNSKTKLKLSDDIFACDFNEALIHQVVTAHLAGARAGTKAQKTRSEVRGGGIKPWKQKGTGRARAGTIRSPLWRKGGKVFAAKPRNYKQKVNKKMYQGALRSIFSELIRQERLLIIDELAIDQPKTKSLLRKLSDLKIEYNNTRLLIISDTIDHNLYLSARNLPQIEVKEANESTGDPVSLVGSEKILITSNAIKKIEELLQ